MLLIVVAPDRRALRSEEHTPAGIGVQCDVGCTSNPSRVRRLSITKPGVYQNILVDGDWTDGTLVKITSDDVTLRNCEIRHGRHNAIVVNARNVTIESCKIHHLLAGTFSDQRDAHGITGQPRNLKILQCDIGLTSGDAIQFDPGRGPWGDVLIENCTIWTGPLPADAAGFKKGERPGENGVDTKQLSSNERSQLTIRNALFFGFRQPGQIGNLAALNLKNNVRVHVENCAFRDNEICFRVRGGGGKYGGAIVSIDRCAAYDSQVAVRAEDQICDLKVRRLGVGPGVEKSLVAAGGGVGPGYENVGQHEPPPIEQVLKAGVLP
jgi:hypothetical protein